MAVIRLRAVVRDRLDSCASADRSAVVAHRAWALSPVKRVARTDADTVACRACGHSAPDHERQGDSTEET